MIVNKTLNKVISSSPTLQETLLDLTADTVAPGNLAKNETAHDKEGDRITGRFLTEDAEAWAVGQRNGVPVTEEDVTYHNNSYWYAKKAEAESVVSGSCMLIAGQHAEDSEAWAVGERDGVPVENTDETYENNAKFYASNAAESEAKAHDSEIISGSFMRIAGNYSEDSEAYAIGKRGGVDVPSTDPTYHNNAKYWADYASQYAQGGLIYKGSILFANIPTSGMVKGDMYNIENDFTTDSRFEEGAGVFVKAGTNIAWNGNKWDVLATGGGGGHTILNESGTELPQRSKLQFEGAIVSDDETNDTTVVETVNPVEYEEDIYGVNLIPYPYKDALPKTSYGVTFTAGSNGAVVANGTNDGTGISEYHFIRILGSELKSLMKNQPCILSGCPSGGTLESYRLNFSRTDSWESVKTDTGEGVTILPSDIEDSVQYIIRILITKNYTVPADLTFHPMLRKATIQDDTYRPYNPQSIQHQLTDQTNVLGAKNLLKNDLVSQVKNGVTFTKNADDSITLSGTATNASGNIWVNIYYLELKKDVLYTLSLGIDESGKESKDACKLRIWNVTGGSAGSIFDIANVQNEVTFSIPDETVQYGIYVGCGREFTGTKTVKPMLRLASDPDDTYVPYAMTNRELTDAVPFKFGVDANGNYGYIKAGADTVTPFKTKNVVDLGTGTSFNVSNIPGYENFTADNFYLVINNYIASLHGGYSQSAPSGSGSGQVYGQAEVKVNNGNNWSTDNQITPTKSYNPSTGVLTISNTSATYGIWVRTVSYRGGANVSSATTGGGDKYFGASVSVRVLLIY